MKNLKTVFKRIRIPTIVLATLVTIFAASGIVNNSTASAWGPTDRPTYTNESPADYATFNSITNNVAVGDERNFVRIREAGTNQTYEDEIEVIPGHEYEVYIYYHNNAATDTNPTGYGIADNTRVASGYPTVVNVGERGMVSAIITWSYVTPSDPDNAKQGSVWDEAYVTSQTNGVVLKYKTGTAIIHNGGEANGSILPTTLFTNEGTPIGYNKLTGTIPGCAEYSGYITYTLVAENPGSEFTKQVSLDGENWSDGVTASPGDFVTYKAIFRNTGNVNFTNLILKDSHDDGLVLRSGSTKIYNYDNVDGYDLEDIIDISGHNTGISYAGSITQLIYQMQVREDVSLCGKTLLNTVTADFNSTEQKTAGAEVYVQCDAPIAPAPTEPTAENCDTNPNLPGCALPQSIVSTGPLEITMAVLVVLVICGAGFYLWRTRRTLKTVEDVVSGDTPPSSSVVSTVVADNVSASDTTIPSSAADSAPVSPTGNSTDSILTTNSANTIAPSTTTSASPAGFSTPAAQNGANSGVSQDSANPAASQPPAPSVASPEPSASSQTPAAPQPLVSTDTSQPNLNSDEFSQESR